MRVARLGSSPLKGGARVHPARVVLTRAGVVGDRRFCCVDVEAGRVLRTVEHPELLGVRARVHGTAGHEVLDLDLPGYGTVSAPVRHGPGLAADYWGRRPWLRLLDGPWAAALGTWLGCPVGLAEAAPGDVVYAGGLTLTTTSAVAEVVARTGRAPLGEDALLDEADRWRSNVVVDTGDAPPWLEDSWVGRTLRVGGALVEVRGAVPRCAVVQRHPGDGAQEPFDALAALAPDRRRDGELAFGLDCVVLGPGEVGAGDEVSPAPSLPR